MVVSKSNFLKELATLSELKENVMSIVFAKHSDLKIFSKSDIHFKVVMALFMTG